MLHVPHSSGCNASDINNIRGRLNIRIMLTNIMSPMEHIGGSAHLPQIIILSTILLIFFVSNLTSGTNLIVNLIPSKWQLITESFLSTIFSFVINNKNLYVYIPLIGFIFFTILISNLLGMIPYCSSITTELALILFIAWSLGIGIFIQGFINHRSKLVHIILPMGTPIFLIPLMIPLELLAYLIRFLSLALRLTINIMTGHILIVVCVSFLYQAYINESTFLFVGIASFLIAFAVLEILIAYLQAYIFTFIFVLTLKEVLG